MKRFIAWTVLILSLLALPALGAVPQTLSYQGVLNDGSGNIVPDGNYSITFRIYDDPILGGPHLLWTEAHDGVTAPVVPVGRGGFNVTLGTAIPVSVRFNAPMWIELQVAPDVTPMSPRTELTPAPFSLNARNIFDGGATNFVGVGRANQVSPAEYFGILAPVASGYGGMYIQTQGAATLPFYGYTTGSAAAWTYLDGSDGNSWKVNNNGDRLTVTNSGQVGIGTSSPTTMLEVRGATKLGGALAPAIKMVKLTGTTHAAQGGTSSISLGGIDPTKIVAIDVMVEYSPGGFPGAFIPPSYLVSGGYEYSWYTDGPAGNITIWNRTGNSASILSKPVKILVTYEE